MIPNSIKQLLKYYVKERFQQYEQGRGNRLHGYQIIISRGVIYNAQQMLISYYITAFQKEFCVIRQINFIYSE